MEDHQQDTSQKPSTKEPKPLLTFWRLIVFCALLAVVIAVGLHYYFQYTRRDCDCAASFDLIMVGASLERLTSEICDLDREISVSELSDTVVRTDAVRFMVGPQYGWRGCTRRCRVLLRFVRADCVWYAQTVALDGSEPSGKGSRYVFKCPAPPDHKTYEIMTGIVDVHNGRSQDWNAYPYRESPDNPELCYTESMVVPVKKPIAGRKFELRAPKGVPCYQIPKSAYNRHDYSK